MGELREFPAQKPDKPDGTEGFEDITSLLKEAAQEKIATGKSYARSYEPSMMKKARDFEAARQAQKDSTLLGKIRKALSKFRL